MTRQQRDRQKLAKLLEADMKIRGTYLAHVIPIENLVREIISYHFCTNESKRNQFLSLLLYGKEYTFSFGIDILSKLVNLHYADVTDKFPNLVKELNKIRNFRNKLVHAMLDTSPEFFEKNLTDTIRLIKYGDKGEINYINITISEVRERINVCLQVTTDLVKVKIEVRNRNQSKQQRI